VIFFDGPNWVQLAKLFILWLRPWAQQAHHNWERLETPQTLISLLHLQTIKFICQRFSRWVKVAVFRPYASQPWKPRVLLARRHMCITTSETSWLTQAGPRGIHTFSSSVECLIHCPGTACVIIMSHILFHPRNSTWHTIVFFVLSPPCPQFLGRILGTSHTGLTGTGVCTCAGARLSRAALIPMNAGLAWTRRQATSGL